MTGTELVIVSVSSSIAGLLFISNLYMLIKNRGLRASATQAHTDRLKVYLQTQELLREQSENVESKDGFVKFMSQSRDWAFEYIEKVQKDLYELNEVFSATNGKPKTVAQNNALTESVRKVLQNLPEQDKK